MDLKSKKINVIMLGPDINLQGGISEVIGRYMAMGLGREVNLRFIPTFKNGSVIIKVAIFFRAYFQFLGALMTTKDPIVHIHVSKKGSCFRKFFFFLAGHTLCQKVLIHVHSSEFDAFTESQAWIQRLVRYMLDRSKGIIVLSELWKEKVKKYTSNEHVYVVYNPMEVYTSIKQPEDRVQVLFLGLLARKKGVYDLLDVVAEKKEWWEDKKVSFILAGSGEDKEIHRYVQDKSIENLVCLPGWVQGVEKKTYLENSHIFILPSYNEQMPMSILEAMGYGYPILSTKVGGISEMVRDGQNGILFDAGNQTVMLKTLQSLINDKSLQKKMSEKSQKIIRDKFESGLIKKKLLNIYSCI